MTPVVLSFFTPNGPYPKMAGRLAQSCDRHGLVYHICELVDRGSWVENCALKAPYIAQSLDLFDCPVLWVDADGEILGPLELLESTEADFGIYARPGINVKAVGRGSLSLPDQWPADLSPRWFNSGTVYFSGREPSRRLLSRWEELCAEKPRDWDQWHLQRAWAETQPETIWLPKSYCAIAGRCEGNAVIRQEIASVLQPEVDRG